MPDPVFPAAATLGDRVRERREQLGLSQEAMAAQIGIHWTYLGQVERGRRDLGLRNLLRIAAGIGVEPGELVKGLKPPAPRA